MNIEQRVIKAITVGCGFCKDEVTSTSTKTSLGMDSLDEVKSLMCLEEEFGIEISDDDAEKMNSVQDVVKYIKEFSIIEE